MIAGLEERDQFGKVAKQRKYRGRAWHTIRFPRPEWIPADGIEPLNIGDREDGSASEPANGERGQALEAEIAALDIRPELGAAAKAQLWIVVPFAMLLATRVRRREQRTTPQDRTHPR